MVVLPSVILRSHAKLNLFLKVLNKRKDNYHNILTLFERIDLCDDIILLSRNDDKIRIICKIPGVPRDATNLCWRSARLLQETFNINKGVDISIIKRIPVGAGLGGGSANAATVFLGLNKLWRLNLSREKLVELAKRIGCDVPFFLYNAPFAVGSGRGDDIRPLSELNSLRLWHVLAVPKVSVSTPLIYRQWDECSGLTKSTSDVKLSTLVAIKKERSWLSEILFNSLEDITIRLYPEVKIARKKLRDLGLELILMSGSGPAVFAIVSSRKEAVSIVSQLKRAQKSWHIFATRTF